MVLVFANISPDISALVMSVMFGLTPSGLAAADEAAFSLSSSLYFVPFGGGGLNWTGGRNSI